MKLDPRSLIAPLVGVAVLALVVQTTLGALKASGTWQPETKNWVRPESPYAGLDAILSRPDTDAPPADLRDPFGYGSANAPTAVQPVSGTRRPVTPVTPPQPARPQLTSIIWDEDPRATVRWEGRDISVRENSLFADFTVKSIRPTEVVLERGGQTVVLKLGKKGE